MTRPNPQRPDTTRLTLLALLTVAFVGALFVLLPAATPTEVQAAPPVAEPLAAAAAPFETVPSADEVFAEGTRLDPAGMAPTF